MVRYRETLHTPGALSFAIPGVVGRMPMAMLSLALVMLLTAVTGSFGIAGVVAATAALAYAVVTPVAARLADRHGQARVLRPQAAVFAAATAALAACAIGRAPVWALAVTGGLSRATLPSLGRGGEVTGPATGRAQTCAWSTAAGWPVRAARSPCPRCPQRSRVSADGRRAR